MKTIYLIFIFLGLGGCRERVEELQRVNDAIVYYNKGEYQKLCIYNTSNCYCRSIYYSGTLVPCEFFEALPR